MLVSSIYPSIFNRLRAIGSSVKVARSSRGEGSWDGGVDEVGNLAHFMHK